MTIRVTLRAWQARRWLRACAQVGVGPHLVGKPTIYADGGQLHIGDRFRLASRPVVSHLVAGPGAILYIGNDVSIGSGAAIAAHLRVQIGSGTRIGPFVVIMDTNFHNAGDHSLQHDCRPVTIGAGCRIGSRVTITRGVTIGDGAEILAGSVVSSVIPPGVCAAGGRARIIGRAGAMTSRWESPAAALPDMLMASLNLTLPPDLDSTQIPTHLWTDAQIPRVLKVIEDECGVVIDRAAARSAKTYADVAAALQHALSERQAQPATYIT
jgi:acetyltransferase-like isoleucine patch superfamily enzyme